MTKKDRRPPNAPKQLRLGDRPPFVSKNMHIFLQVFLVVIGVGFIRWLHYSRTVVNPQLKSDVANASYSSFNSVGVLWSPFTDRSFRMPGEHTVHSVTLECAIGNHDPLYLEWPGIVIRMTVF